MSELTTTKAVAAVAYARAPKCLYADGTESRINRRIVCADGFTVSVQASSHHYAHDQADEAPYWSIDERPIEYPFRTFEVGNPSADPEPADQWEKYDNGGIWAWVPRGVVAALLNRHGGAVGWEKQKAEASSVTS